jgi:hypothetical protein
MPGAAARLADVGAGDLHPLEVGRGSQHFPQQLAMAGLDPGTVSQAQARLGDPVGQLVTEPLQLAEVEDPRLRRDRADPVVELDPAEGLGKEARELALEPADLAPQLVAGQALVDPDLEGVEAVSLEQTRHSPRTECKSRPAAGKAATLRPCMHTGPKARRVHQPPSRVPPRRRSAARH